MPIFLCCNLDPAGCGCPAAALAKCRKFRTSFVAIIKRLARDFVIQIKMLSFMSEPLDA